MTFIFNKDTLYLDLLYKMDVGKKKPQMILFKNNGNLNQVQMLLQKTCKLGTKWQCMNIHLKSFVH